MLYALLLLSLLVWLPVLFCGIERRGFVLLLVWLSIAPIAVNLLERPGTNPFFSAVVKQAEAGGGSKGPQGGYFTREASIKLTEMLQPTRVFLGSFFVVFLINAIMRRKRLGPFDNTEKFACIFALMLITSALFQSKRTAYSLRIACDAFIVPFIAYFCARRLVNREDQLRKLIRVIGYLGIFLIGVGLVERLTMSGFSSRVEGPFDDRNGLYIVMAVVFFVVLVDWLRSGNSPDRRKALPRVVQQFVLCFVPVIILLGWGRGNLMGFLSGIWVFLFLGRKLVGLRSKIAIAGLALLLGPIIALGLYEFTPKEIVERRIARTSTVFARFGAWQNIIQETSKSPIFGIGLNNLRDALYEGRSRFEGITSENTAHNSFLSISGELGLLGLFTYLAIMASIIRTGMVLYRSGYKLFERLLGVAVIAVVVAYLVAALFVNLLYITVVSHVYVYVFVGGVAGLYARRPSRAEFSESPANVKWTRPDLAASA